MRWGAGLVLLCGAATACSSSGSAPSTGMALGAATIDNTFTFMPAHYTASAAAMQTDTAHTSIVVTSLRGTDACSAMQANAGVANTFQVVVTLDPQTIPPGTHTLGDGWQASYNMADTNCNSAGESAAIAGNLEIDEVNGSLFGIADMTFSGGRVIADFNAPMCASGTATSGGTACAQLPACPIPQGADLNPTPTETCNELTP